MFNLKNINLIDIKKFYIKGVAENSVSIMGVASNILNIEESGDVTIQDYNCAQIISFGQSTMFGRFSGNSKITISG